MYDLRSVHHLFVAKIDMEPGNEKETHHPKSKPACLCSFFGGGVALVSVVFQEAYFLALKKELL